MQVVCGKVTHIETRQTKDKRDYVDIGIVEYNGMSSTWYHCKVWDTSTVNLTVGDELIIFGQLERRTSNGRAFFDIKPFKVVKADSIQSAI